ncbi:unnamed protein product [Owenia fusiformis]|uniref:Uncharacterized protein n=1 Tax=Owenia fusiformis TaxID=6347 RepID=A0A8S4N491_OWEFU|nr:unnamed protein product [Owenia fusiformis]
MWKLLISLALVGICSAEWYSDTDIKVTVSDAPAEDLVEGQAARLVTDAIPKTYILGKVDTIVGIIEDVADVIKVITTRRGSLRVLTKDGKLMVCPWKQRGHISAWRWKWWCTVSCPNGRSARVRTLGRDSGVASAGCQVQRQIMGAGPRPITFTYRRKNTNC